jgi:hypothetical protein
LPRSKRDPPTRRMSPKKRTEHRSGGDDDGGEDRGAPQAWRPGRAERGRRSNRRRCGRVIGAGTMLGWRTAMLRQSGSTSRADPARAGVTDAIGAELNRARSGGHSTRCRKRGLGRDGRLDRVRRACCSAGLGERQPILTKPAVAARIRRRGDLGERASSRRERAGCSRFGRATDVRSRGVCA